MDVGGEDVGVLVGDVDEGSGGGVLKEAGASRDVLGMDGKGMVFVVFADDDIDALVVVADSVTRGF